MQPMIVLYSRNRLTDRGGKSMRDIGGYGTMAAPLTAASFP